MSKATALPLAALAFCVWAVYLGGLASMQAQCDSDTVLTPLGTAHLLGVSGFSAGIVTCWQVYAYYWFIMSFEIVLIIALAIVSLGNLERYSNAFVGLFSVATLLYIQTCNAFNTAQSVDWYQEDTQLHRIRCTVAGAIMTAVVNGMIVIALGTKDGEAKAAKEPEAKVVSAV